MLKELSYPKLCDFELRIHFMFGSTYLCKTFFLKIKFIENERHSFLSDESHLIQLAMYDMRVDVSDIANKRFRKSE